MNNKNCLYVFTYHCAQHVSLIPEVLLHERWCLIIEGKPLTESDQENVAKYSVAVAEKVVIVLSRKSMLRLLDSCSLQTFSDK